MISIEPIVIVAPKGLFSGTPGSVPLDFTGSVVGAVTPVFHRLVQTVKENTDNKDIADAWKELPPQGGGGSVMFIAVNTNDAATIYEEGSIEHDISQPEHWIPIQPLIRFYEEKKGLSGREARAAAYGFQKWAHENPFTVNHPGTRAHHNARDAFEGYRTPLIQAAQEGFARAITQRFA